MEVKHIFLEVKGITYVAVLMLMNEKTILTIVLQKIKKIISSLGAEI